MEESQFEKLKNAVRKLQGANEDGAGWDALSEGIDAATELRRQALEEQLAAAERVRQGKSPTVHGERAIVAAELSALCAARLQIEDDLARAELLDAIRILAASIRNHVLARGVFE